LYGIVGIRVDLDESGVVIWSEETVIAEMKQELVIVLAKEGDQEAFHELYKTHRLPVYRTAFRLMRFKEDAEDIMHETFIRAFRNIRSFDMNVGTNFGAWINRICVNCAIEHLRKHKNRKPHQLDSLTGPQSEPKAGGPSPEDSAVDSQTRQKLHEAMNILTPKQRTIFNLRYSQNMDIREIAECLQCSESTIKTQHMRAVSKLRRRLRPLWRAA
jgi:RNA polymerase sigma-70 factor (ECF subfamily)